VAAARVGEDPEIIATLVRAVANPVERPNALKLISEGKVGRYSLTETADAFWYSMLGANERALESLEQWAATSEQGQSFAASQNLWTQAFDPIRNDERFRAVTKLAGLPTTPAKSENKS
jgi:hypothetical protein